MRLSFSCVLAAVLILGAASGVRAQSCDFLGGDSDGDGICDDGSGSGVVGDLPCSCQPPAPPGCVAGCDDNCTFATNPDQLDIGRVGVPDLPDGIGDACQCFDVGNDGRGDIRDVTLLRRALVPLPPALIAPQKCPGPGSLACDAADVTELRNVLADLSPAPANACLASGACVADVDCPGGLGCDFAAARCEKYLGQVCVQADQCLSNGCCSDECTNVANDLANCGGCGVICTNPHGTTACGAGACLPSCNAGFASCDGNPVNGCERSLQTLSDCGGCGVACALPNANESCSTGTCQLTTCNSGFANCDANQANGCELQLSSASNASPGENLGSFSADSASGFLCPDVGCTLAATRSGTRERFFNVTAREDSTCSAYVALRFNLTVPAGVDYDLRVTGGCNCVSGCTSTNGTGSSEEIVVWCSDDPFTSQTFSAVAEVYYYGGSSCSAWTLSVSRGGC